MLLVKVTVSNRDGTVLCRYTMDHDDIVQRRILGEQCRNALEAGQSVNTTPKHK